MLPHAPLHFLSSPHQAKDFVQIEISLTRLKGRDGADKDSACALNRPLVICDVRWRQQHWADGHAMAAMLPPCHVRKNAPHCVDAPTTTRLRLPNAKFRVASRSSRC